MVSPTLVPEERTPCCPECDYNLTGAPGRRCPWCGWEIEPDILIARSRHRTGGRRLAVVCAALGIGLGALLLVITLVGSAQALSLYDGIAALGVMTAAVGHLSLAVRVITQRGTWPLRGQDAGQTLRMVGWASVLAGTIGALPVWQVLPHERVIRGVAVHGALEFVMLSLLLTTPGWTLLLLRLVTFRSASPRPSSRANTGWGEGRNVGAGFLIEVFGRFDRDHVKQVSSGKPRPTTPAIEAAIARIWETETSLADLDGRTLENKALGRLVTHRVVNGTLTFVLGRTCYRDFLGTNVHNPAFVRRIEPKALANPLGVSTLLMTRDGYLVLGRRGTGVAIRPGCLHSFGGMVDGSDRTGVGYDLFGCALRELDEELGVGRAEIDSICVMGMVRDKGLHQPELLFETRTRLTRSEVLQRFQRTRSGGEHVGIECVAEKPDALVPFIDQAEPITPVAQSMLVLHGWHTWGKAWYEQSCIRLYGEQPVNRCVP